MRNDFVASGVVMNKSYDKILFVYHKKLQKWLYPGGHLDPNELPHIAAQREVLEETGVKADVVHVGIALNLDTKNKDEAQMPTPLCVLYEKIPANAKEEEHMHYDFVYLMVAKDTQIQVAEREVAQVEWLSKDQIAACDTFEGVRKMCVQVLEEMSVVYGK